MTAPNFKLGRKFVTNYKMEKVIQIDLKNYFLTPENLEKIASEFYGKPLTTAGDNPHNSLEYEFQDVVIDEEYNETITGEKLSKEFLTNLECHKIPPPPKKKVAKKK